MNKFYDQPKLLQWVEAIIILFIGMFPALYIIELSFSKPYLYLLLIIHLPLGQFSLTPIATLMGIYKYYSPMLSALLPTDKEIEIHNGSSFDYLFIKRKFKAGATFRYYIIYCYLEGLLKIIENIEAGKRPETVKIVGTSYFFNQRTATKLGFSVKNASILNRINLLLNFIDLFWMYSISRGKPSIPNLLKVNKVVIDGKTLVENKNNILSTYYFLEEKIKGKKYV